MMLKSGHCISGGANKKFGCITIGIEKRDQYKHGMDKLFHWTGYGILEVLENHVCVFSLSFVIWREIRRN